MDSSNNTIHLIESTNGNSIYCQQRHKNTHHIWDKTYQNLKQNISKETGFLGEKIVNLENDLFLWIDLSLSLSDTLYTKTQANPSLTCADDFIH